MLQFQKTIFSFKALAIIALFCSCSFNAWSNPDSLHIYLIPGTGSDARVFNNLSLSNKCTIHHIEYFTPEKGISIEEYAKALTHQIDTSSKFVLIGVSLGGMLAVEMNEFISPAKTILISSAKTKFELPSGYRFQQKIPVYKLIGPKLAKAASQIVQPIFESDRKCEAATFKSMLKNKDPLFLTRAIAMTMEWKREVSTFNNIYHIHGEKDHTIPIRNVDCDYKIKKGSHLIALTRGNEISKIIANILK